MFKKFISIILVLILLSSFSACSNSNSSNDNLNEETVNFDLGKYKDHGELSEGRIWVIKETSDWDTDPYESYAYLDCDGKVIYGWNEVGTYYNNGFYDCRATRPQNFKNGYALIYDQSGVDKLGGYAKATVINKSGKEIADFLIDAYEGNNDVVLDYEDFNSQGYAFFIGKENYDDEKGMFFINRSGVHRFQCNEKSYISGHTLKCIDLVNEKYLYVSWCNNQLFDLDGNLVIDIGESTGIDPYSIEIINDSYIEGRFTGKDDKEYICVIDFYGNIVKSPVLASKYKRDNELLKTKTSNKAEALKKSNIKKGNIVKIGTYEQNNITYNGPDPIEWIVLDNDGNRALLISKYVLESYDYAENMRYSKTITWENSGVREWLNNDFLNTAFSNDEIGCILPSQIESKVITYTGVYNNQYLREDIASRDVSKITTTDKVFLLSVDEIKNLMSTNEIAGIGTKYSAERVSPTMEDGDTSKRYYLWMTRDLVGHIFYSGIYDKYVLSFSGKGDKIYNYENWETPNLFEPTGVRPAIYIDLNKLK